MKKFSAALIIVLCAALSHGFSLRKVESDAEYSVADKIFAGDVVTVCIVAPEEGDFPVTEADAKNYMTIAAAQWTRGVAGMIKDAGRGAEFAEITGVLDRPVSINFITQCFVTDVPYFTEDYPQYKNHGGRADIRIILSDWFEDITPQPHMSMGAYGYYIVLNTDSVFRNAGGARGDSGVKSKTSALADSYSYARSKEFFNELESNPYMTGVSILMHEFGHALTFEDRQGYHSAMADMLYTTDVFADSIMKDAVSLKKDDVDGMIALYEKRKKAKQGCAYKPKIYNSFYDGTIVFVSGVLQRAACAVKKGADVGGGQCIAMQICDIKADACQTRCIETEEFAWINLGHPGALEYLKTNFGFTDDDFFEDSWGYFINKGTEKEGRRHGAWSQTAVVDGAAVTIRAEYSPDGDFKVKSRQKSDAASARVKAESMVKSLTE